MYVILDRCYIHSDLSDSFLERSIRLVLPLKWAQSLARLESFLRELRARELGKEGRKLGGGRVHGRKLGEPLRLARLCFRSLSSF